MRLLDFPTWCLSWGLGLGTLTLATARPPSSQVNMRWVLNIQCIWEVIHNIVALIITRHMWVPEAPSPSWSTSSILLSSSQTRPARVPGSRSKSEFEAFWVSALRADLHHWPRPVTRLGMMIMILMMTITMLTLMMVWKYIIHNDGGFQWTDHSDVVEHEVSTALLLRREFVTVVKCVTVMGVGHQLRLRTKMSDLGDLGEEDTCVGCFGVGLWLERYL